MKASRNLSRRRLLQGAAASAAVPPLLGRSEPSFAGQSAPRRLILMLSPNGMSIANWKPTGTPDNWSLSPILEPLAALKDKIVVLDGVDDEASHHIPGEMLTTGHQTVSSVWSGTVPDVYGDGFLGSGVTVDQYIASRIDETIFPSLETGVMLHPQAVYNTRMSYSGPGSFVHPEANPYQLLERVFGDVNATEAQAAKLLAQRETVLSSIRADLAGLEDASVGDDRLKAQQHLVALDILESQLGGIQCGAPDVVMGEQLEYSAYDNLPLATKTTMDILVAAMECDATRVATIHLTQENSNARYDFLGLSAEDTRHHVLSHAYPGNPGYDDFMQINRWHCEQYAYLLAELDKRDEPGGVGSMLDNSVVVWASNLSKSHRHEARNLPIVLGGSCGGYFETGKWHKWGDYQVDVNSWDPHGGRTMNDLLISLCHAMGFDDVETFGDPAFCTGPLL